MKTYIIKDWQDVFEDRVSRGIQNVRYARLPLERESEVFMDMMQSAKGREAYGAFCALLRVASRCKVRGRLEDDRGPLTIDRLAARTYIPAKALKACIDFLTSNAVGWIIEVESDTPDLRARATTVHHPPAHARSPDLHQETPGAHPRSGNERKNERKKQQQQPSVQTSEGVPGPQTAPPAAAAEVVNALKTAGIGNPELAALASSGLTIEAARTTIAAWKATGKGIGVLVLDLRNAADRCVQAKTAQSFVDAFQALDPSERHEVCDRFRASMGQTWAHVSDERVVPTSKFREYLATGGLSELPSRELAAKGAA